MDIAFKTAAQLMLQARSRVPKIVILLTGGKDGVGAQPLGVAVQRLKYLGIRSYVIAFGTKPDLEHLRPAVDKSENLLFYPVSKNLRPKGPETARHIAYSKFARKNLSTEK
jgi:hypothetical protein